MKKFSADFETATWNPKETWVWAWAVCNINNTDEIKIGNNIDTFIEFCKNSDNSTFYFHNLKFDSEFIIYYLLTNGYTHIQDKKDRKDKTFTTLISDMGQFYSLEIYFEVKNKKCIKATFIDSLKIIPFKVEVIAKSFGLSISKLEIDYNKYRPKGWNLTKDERDYITNDVKIVAEALHQLFDKGLTKMTQGSNALSDYKKMTGKYRFKHFFPKLDPEVDEDIRKSYKRRLYLFKSYIFRKRSRKRCSIRCKFIIPLGYEI